jgi:hypothetical protein
MMNITKRYARTSKGFSGRGQQALMVEFFDSRPNGADIKDAVRYLEAHPKFSTNQTAERIAAYYICVLKKSGHIVLTESSDRVDATNFYGEIDLELANGK